MIQSGHLTRDIIPSVSEIYFYEAAIFWSILVLYNVRLGLLYFLHTRQKLLRKLNYLYSDILLRNLFAGETV